MLAQGCNHWEIKAVMWTGGGRKGLKVEDAALAGRQSCIPPDSAVCLDVAVGVNVLAQGCNH